MRACVRASARACACACACGCCTVISAKLLHYFYARRAGEMPEFYTWRVYLLLTLKFVQGVHLS